MDASFWDEIERSRDIPGSQKMSESLHLFDAASRRMLAGIKASFPASAMRKLAAFATSGSTSFAALSCCLVHLATLHQARIS